MIIYIYIQGGAELTDTFRIGILRRRDSLSWLAARGIAEERMPFHMVLNSMAVVREMFGTVISRFGDITWPARSPNLTVPDFSWGGSWKTVCSGGVSWLFKNSNKPLLTKLRLLMTYGGTCTATSRHACNKHWCKRSPSMWRNFQKTSL